MPTYTSRPTLTRIAASAREAGLEVPFMRPAELAADNAGTYPVLIHALDHYRSCRGTDPDIVVLMQPTSPFRTGTHLREALDLYRRAASSPQRGRHGGERGACQDQPLPQLLRGEPRRIAPHIQRRGSDTMPSGRAPGVGIQWRHLCHKPRLARAMPLSAFPGASNIP